jgi:hypothetical protein
MRECLGKGRIAIEAALPFRDLNRCPYIANSIAAAAQENVEDRLFVPNEGRPGPRHRIAAGVADRRSKLRYRPSEDFHWEAVSRMAFLAASFGSCKPDLQP